MYGIGDTLYAVSDAAHRFRGIDAARGIAACLVVLAHCIETSSPGVFGEISRFVLPGVGSVFVFFLISGYVISSSLNRVSDVRQFAIARFWRLYPLFFASVLLAYFVIKSGMSPWWLKSNLDLSAVMNLTTVQEFLGFPSLLGLYWSLGYETIFYIGLGLLYVFHLHRSAWKGIYILIIVISVLAGASFVRGQSFGGDRLIGFVFMVLGISFFEHREGRISTKHLFSISVLALSALSLQWCASILTNPHSEAKPSDICTGWLSLGAFWCAVFVKDKVVPTVFVELGRISYSIYIVHGLVLMSALRLGMAKQPALFMVTVFVTTILISTATYRWIEEPGIALGKRLIASLKVSPPLPRSLK